VLMVLAMGIMITVIAFAPSLAVQILFVVVYSYAMFSFTYVVLKRWYLAAFPPIVFALSYFLYPRLFVMNLFALIFAIIVTVYLGALFSWKTTLIFAILLTIMDVFQVFVTGFMGESAGKMLELRLPVAVLLQTYPAGTWIGLGLGDIFLSGLLSIQTASKYGHKAGILTAATIGIAMFVFEVMLLSSMLKGIEYFPATVVVMSGWIAGMGISCLTHFGLFHNYATKPRKYVAEK